MIVFLKFSLIVEASFMIFLNDNKTSWSIDDKEINIFPENVISSRYYKESGVVVFLNGKELNNPEALQVFNIKGERLLSLSRPKGYQYVYLTTHPKAEICIVCGLVDIEDSNESWSDFYFGIDLERGIIEKIGVAR